MSEEKKIIRKKNTTGCSGELINFQLTVKQLKVACKKHPYILARFYCGHQMAINSKIYSIAEKIKKYNDNDLTDIVSFIPCDMNEYISQKSPFM